MESIEWRPSLDAATKDWLIAHNGEALPVEVLGKVVAAGGVVTSNSWWIGEERPDGFFLSDEAVNWTEAVGNAEKPSTPPPRARIRARRWSDEARRAMDRCNVVPVLEAERIPLRLSLLENAYDSFAESLAYVEKATADPTRWKFAVLNLVHAVELVLKQRLIQEHDLLIWQDVDRPGKLTVGLEKAIQRLLTARVVMDESDVQAIQTAIRWRNNITHYEVDLIAEEVRENYLLIFEFLDKFHGAHFSGSLSEHIPDSHVETAMDLAESFKREFIEFRGRQMHRSWPRKLVAAQNVAYLELDGVRFARTQWGSEAYWAADHMEGYEPLPFCRDCGAAIGEYHGPGCCVEECPREKSQLFGCECDWDPSELWALDADSWADDVEEDESAGSTVPR